MAFEVVPSIDLRGGKVVRLQQGDYSRQLDYDLDSVKTAQSFQSAGAGWMHIVDLDGAKEGRPVQTELIRSVVSSSKLKIQVGGGIRSRADIDVLLGIGVKRVVIGTAALENWKWFTELVAGPGMEGKIVLAIDAKDGVVATRGWTHSSGKNAIDIAREVSDWPIGALLYTDVAKDGMMQGPNLGHTRALAEATKAPVIASGGVKDLSHIAALMKLPVWGVIVGRSLHEGTLDLRQAIELTRRRHA